MTIVLFFYHFRLLNFEFLSYIVLCSVEATVFPFKTIIVSDLASFLIFSLPRRTLLRNCKLAAHILNTACRYVLFGSHDVLNLWMSCYHLKRRFHKMFWTFGFAVKYGNLAALGWHASWSRMLKMHVCSGWFTVISSGLTLFSCTLHILELQTPAVSCSPKPMWFSSVMI